MKFEDDETICGGVIQQELDVIFKSFGWPILYQIGDIKPQHGAHGSGSGVFLVSKSRVLDGFASGYCARSAEFIEVLNWGLTDLFLVSCW
ncbi:hypothetical protein MTR_1g083870 [Medicago truncatula]|uniref:Uncharacterized protein n=1 Tax=Medicago truncatula TaxID=3880 RepID=G7I9G4_MEDTR|nr:hypothetical protein MTR_1g083870 [Medicago truncatula]